MAEKNRPSDPSERECPLVDEEKFYNPQSPSDHSTQSTSALQAEIVNLRAETVRLRASICAIMEAAENEDNEAFTQAMHEARDEVTLSALGQSGFSLIPHQRKAP